MITSVPPPRLLRASFAPAPRQLRASSAPAPRKLRQLCASTAPAPRKLRASSAQAPRQAPVCKISVLVRVKTEVIDIPVWPDTIGDLGPRCVIV